MHSYFNRVKNLKNPFGLRSYPQHLTADFFSIYKTDKCKCNLHMNTVHEYLLVVQLV